MDTGVYCPLKIDQNSTNQLIIVDWTFTRNNWHVGTNDWSMDLVFETQLPPTTTLDHRGLPCRPDTLTHWPNGSTYWPAVQPIDLPDDPLIIQLDSFTLQFDQSTHWFDQLTLQFDQSGSIQWPTMHRHAVQFTNPLVWPIQKPIRPIEHTSWSYSSTRWPIRFDSLILKNSIHYLSVWLITHQFDQLKLTNFWVDADQPA